MHIAYTITYNVHTASRVSEAQKRGGAPPPGIPKWSGAPPLANPALPQSQRCQNSLVSVDQQTKELYSNLTARPPKKLALRAPPLIFPILRPCFLQIIIGF